MVYPLSEITLSRTHVNNIVNRLANDNDIQIEQSKAARDNYWQQIAHTVASVYKCKI